MKYLFAAFFCFLALLTGAQQDAPLRGYTYSIDRAGVASDTVLSRNLWYNAAGTLLKEETIIHDSRGLHRITKLYDANGRLRRKEGSFKYGALISNTDFERDEKGEISKQAFSGSDGETTLLHHNVYGSNGKLASFTMTPANAPKDGAPELTSTSEYSYDAQNRLVRIQQAMGGKFYSDCTITYDSRNNRESETTVSSEGTARYVFAYDAENRKVLQRAYNGAELLATTTYTWSGSRPLEERTQLPDGTQQVLFYK